MISNEEIAPYSDLDLTTLIHHLDLADPIDKNEEDDTNSSFNFKDKSSSHELNSSDSDQKPVFSKASCYERVPNLETQKRVLKGSSTNCYSNYSNTFDNSSGYSFRPQSTSQSHIKDYSQVQPMYGPVYSPCQFNHMFPQHPQLYSHHQGFPQKNFSHRINFPNYNNSLMFNSHQNYNGGYINNSVIINNNCFIMPHPSQHKFCSQGENFNKNSPQIRRSKEIPSNFMNVNHPQNHILTVNNFCSPKNKDSSCNNYSSYCSEEVSDENSSDDEKIKSSEETETIINGFSSISDFIQNCDNPRKYLNSMKGNREIIKLARLSTPSQQIALLEKIKPSLNSIMVSNSGNYFCQDFFSLLSKDGRQNAWSVIKEKIDFYGTQQFSNHVIQKLVDLAVDSNEQKEIVVHLIPYFEILAFNSHGTHILQKIILNYEDLSKQELSNYITSNFEALVFDSCGVCLIKKYIIYLKGKSIKHKTDFLYSISDYIPLMLNDIYAHYAILCIIDEWKQRDYMTVLELITKSLTKVSSQKYASRIIEKLVCVLKKVS